jgi:hypothetical protein
VISAADLELLGSFTALASSDVEVIMLDMVSVVYCLQVISAADVALYGGLTALASFDRSELRSQVINNIGFREFMELYPEVRVLQGSWFMS